VIDEVTRAVERVALGLRPPGIPPANGFCLPTGQVMAMDYGGFNEAVDIEYRLKGGETLKVHVSTNGNKPETTLRQNLREGAESLRAEMGLEMKVTWLADVDNASFDGKAAAVSLGGFSQHLVWRAPGAARAPNDPYIEVRIESPRPDSEALLQAIVASLRPISTAR
jgi:hypothetical protein